MKEEEITTENVEYTGQNDAGDIYKLSCPKCNETVDACLTGGEWWSTQCSCGYSWSVDIVATGYKYE